ncbi:MAG: hypothetical protein ACI8XO_000737 [Verrucomicrobiales bacterium]|jgi:uncharacterized protein (DUF1501 family)
MKTSLNQFDDPSRRQFMSGVAKTFLGVGLLPGASAFAAGGEDRGIPLRSRPAKKIIYLYMSGGMSHLDTFDPKPEADAAIRGNLSAIKTKADGVRISEYLPRLARHMDKAVVVNSLYSRTGAHEQGQYLMRTNYEKRGTIKHPHMGAWLLKYQDRINPQLPGFVAINSGSKNVGSGFFGSAYAPLVIGRPDAGLQNSAHAKNTDASTFERRRKLATQLDQDFRNKYQDKDAAAYTTMYDEAVTLMKSRDLDAFDLSKETQEMRDLYGSHSFGQGCLLARRLSESGVRSVEVQMGGWDTHQENFERVAQNTAILDQAMSALLGDLSTRGLLDETLIVLTTEFGRTPNINQNNGRDHYPKAFSAVLAGGGVKGGTVYGKTDENGTKPIEDAIKVSDFNATIAYGLGLPLDQRLFSPSARPFTVAHKGTPATKLFT